MVVSVSVDVLLDPRSSEQKVLTSFWCSAEQKYRSTPACAQALQRRVEGVPHTQHFFSSACELMARETKCGRNFDEKRSRSSRSEAQHEDGGLSSKGSAELVRSLTV